MAAPDTNIQILPYALPRLSGGLYEAKFDLQVTHVPGDEVVNASYSHSQKFHVAAPRFMLPMDDVKGLYPARSSSGAFHTTFPHITFQRKTTPWERDIFHSHATKTPLPWMSLLLLDEDELRDPSISQTTLPVAELDFPDVMPFEIDDRDGPVLAKLLTLPRAKFQEIFAGQAHFHKLAHVRKSSLAHKEQGSSFDDGEYAVMVCNRLPKAGKTNQVFLVSLEAVDFQASNPVRLVVLHSWTFYAEGADFATLVDQLQLEWLRVDDAQTGVEAKSMEAMEIKGQMAAGFVPVYYEPHAEEPTLAWYRGPLIPFLPELNEALVEQKEVFTQDHGASGMLDITYAAAYELGKMLALQNQGYVKALQAWENKRASVQDALEKHKPIGGSKELSAAANATNSQQELDFLRQNEILQEMLLDYWQSQSPPAQ